MTGQNPECSFLKRGDFNDCAHAGGGRGAPLSDWCKPCLLARVEKTEAELDEARAVVESVGEMNARINKRLAAAERVCAIQKEALEAMRHLIAVFEAEFARGDYSFEMHEALTDGEAALLLAGAYLRGRVGEPPEETA